jgi:hypothetical protein
MTSLLIARYYCRCKCSQAGYIDPRKRAGLAGRGVGTEMLKLKGCPRCKRGDVVLDRDPYGCYEYCIQCGYMGDLIGTVELEQQQACSVKGRKKRDKTSGKGK